MAADAQLSHTLVLFHFERKERLVHALLDWLIATTSVLHVSADVARPPHAHDRLHALLQQEMARLSHEPRHTRLFFEFWARPPSAGWWSSWCDGARAPSSTLILMHPAMPLIRRLVLALARRSAES